MNRYRTVPGLGPSSSKATTTTTCQKCLKKGHYSYECKASVQNRPYTSRPSRSQQLLNPKLKPALVEQKMEEPDKLSESAKRGDQPETSRVDAQPELKKDTHQNVASGKRPRSASLSSASSVATISTDASVTRGENSRPTVNRSDHRQTRSRLSSNSRSSSISHRLEEAVSGHYQDNQHFGGSRSLAHHRPHQVQHVSDSDEVEPSARRSLERHGRQEDRSLDDRQRSERRNKRRRSQSADIVPGHGSVNSSSHHTRHRSLSPYSRRLALTQAMNSDSR